VLAPRAAPASGWPRWVACFTAGSRPKRTLETIEMTTAKTTTRGSSEMSSTRGNVVGAVLTIIVSPP